MLAGGAGRRLLGPGARGSSKAAAPLAGRPLVTYPLSVLGEVCRRLAVVCKRETPLPDVGRAERWDEPDHPRHPLTGITYALHRAGGPILVCAADMPFVTPSVCRELIAASGAAPPALRATVADGPADAPADAGAAVDAGATADAGPERPLVAVAAAEGRLEPLLGVYAPAALSVLSAAPPDAPLRATVERLAPWRVAVAAEIVRSVNTPEDLDAALRALSARSR